MKRFSLSEDGLMHPERSRMILPLLLAGCLASPGAAQEKPDFARWEKAIAAFEARDAEDPPPKGAVLFVGSSSVRLWDLGKSFPGLATVNRGFGGSRIADATHFAPRIVLPHKPRAVVLYAGDNDLAGGKSPEQVHADFRAFVKAVHAGLPEARILFLAIKPSLRRWGLVDKVRKANALIAEECKGGERLTYVDVFTPMLGKDGRPRAELFAKDGLHLNAEGYKVWASVLGPLLSEGDGPTR